jgi:hypothetical protein
MGEEGRRDGTTKDASGVRTVGDSSYFHGVGGEWRSEAEAYDAGCKGDAWQHGGALHCTAMHSVQCAVCYARLLPFGGGHFAETPRGRMRVRAMPRLRGASIRMPYDSGY